MLELTKNDFWVQDENDMESSDQTHILAQCKQQRGDSIIKLEDRSDKTRYGETNPFDFFTNY
jgi:hypothetical protein